MLYLFLVFPSGSNTLLDTTTRILGLENPRHTALVFRRHRTLAHCPVPPRPQSSYFRTSVYLRFDAFASRKALFPIRATIAPLASQTDESDKLLEESTHGPDLALYDDVYPYINNTIEGKP
jgi:hypothetical protein